MSRPRRIPLFEFMRETDRKVPPPPPIHARRSESATSSAERSGPVQVFPRITTAEHAAAAAGATLPEPALLEDAAGPRTGLFLSYAAVGIALAAIVVVGVLVAVVAYRTGAEDEKNQLLAARTQSPPGTANPGPSEARPSGVAPEQRSTETEGPAAPRATPSNTVLPVTGDDPRQAGWNYLIIATLFRNDATAAAEFLSTNGIPAVVVAPEGKSPDELMQDRRANWLVIAREGIAPDAYKTATAQTRRNELVREVRSVGRRWKQDHKGSSDFADVYWNKFGK